LKKAVHRYADLHADADGLVTSPVKGLRMMRLYKPSGPIRSMYRPLVCLILQGSKQMTIGRQARVFEAGQSVIVGIDVPVIGRITQATREQPYLAVAIEIDLPVLQEVVLQTSPAAFRPERQATPLFAEDLDATIIGCASRMVALIDHPEAESLLRPAILLELHYWLLRSRHGQAIRNLVLPDGAAHRIAASIERIRQGFRDELSVERLAEMSHMSASAFHRRFRALTSLSPLQFQKQLRLIEARRLMLSEGRGVGESARMVGYESASQFTREYHRMFGAPPKRDTACELSRTV
jgi:AraC-like DNA-binding protein